MKKNGDWNLRNIRWKRVLFGTAVSTLATMTLAAGFAWLMDREILGVQWMGYAAFAVLLFSTFLGTAVTSEDGGLLEPGLASVLYWVVLVGINAVMYECALSGVLPTLAAIAGGWGSAMLLLNFRRLRRPRRRRKYRSR